MNLEENFDASMKHDNIVYKLRSSFLIIVHKNFKLQFLEFNQRKLNKKLCTGNHIACL